MEKNILGKQEWQQVIHCKTVITKICYEHISKYTIHTEDGVFAYIEIRMKNMNKIVVNDWNCYILDNITDKNPVMIYWGVSKDNKSSVEKIYNQIKKSMNGNDSYIIVAYEVPDWNSYFSPWAYKMNDKNVFMGYGSITLQWLMNSYNIIEEMYHVKYHIDNRYLIGYSLSGLFSLWAFYESKLFSGVACCSGSLWFPGWTEYAINNQIQVQSKIYLSLGKKEEKTKNQIMKKIGEIIRWQFHILENNEKISKIKLEWNEGGHFNNIEDRIIAGINWLKS